MPMNSDMMKAMMTRNTCQLTPIAALPANPTKWPTIMWSTKPCMPPTMFANTVGHASFHTAVRSGPSMIDRSYRRAVGAGGGSGGGTVGAEMRSANAVTSVIDWAG